MPCSPTPVLVLVFPSAQANITPCRPALIATISSIGTARANTGLGRTTASSKSMSYVHAMPVNGNPPKMRAHPANSASPKGLTTMMPATTMREPSRGVVTTCL